MPVVYWEKQEDNRMCALHCLNALLQGPYVTVEELTTIANFLDEQERKLVGWIPATNSSHDGNYNITVIQESLGNRGFECKYCTAKNLTKQTVDSKFDGFLCNVSQHWICFRNVHGDWYMLDSMKSGPIRYNVSDLQEYLETLLKQGDSVFIITPTENARPFSLPNPDKNHTKKNQFYIDIRDISTYEGKTDYLYKKGCNSQSKPVSWPTTGGTRLDSCDTSTKFKIKSNNNIYNSMNEPQKIDGPSCSITVRMFDASRLTNRFSLDSTLVDVFKWLESCDIVVNDVPLSSQPIYCLVQQTPFRKFVKYADGSTELIDSQHLGIDTKNKTLKELDLEDTQLFILHIPTSD